MGANGGLRFGDAWSCGLRKEAHERRDGRWLGEEQRRLLVGVAERRAEQQQRSRDGQQSFARRRKWIGFDDSPWAAVDKDGKCTWAAED
jgi:hypothetical protein